MGHSGKQPAEVFERANQNLASIIQKSVYSSLLFSSLLVAWLLCHKPPGTLHMGLTDFNQLGC